MIGTINMIITGYMFLEIGTKLSFQTEAIKLLPFIRACAQIISDHYPERLSRLWLGHLGRPSDKTDHDESDESLMEIDRNW